MDILTQRDRDSASPIKKSMTDYVTLLLTYNRNVLHALRDLLALFQELSVTDLIQHI